MYTRKGPRTPLPTATTTHHTTLQTKTISAGLAVLPNPLAIAHPLQATASPKPPPHVRSGSNTGSEAKRQFSFHNVFARSRPGTSDEDNRPMSRGAMSFASGSRKANVITEEERLGLVHGDSSKNMSRYSEVPEGRESDEWQVTSGASSSSPEMLGASGDLGQGNSTSSRGKRDPYDDGDYDDDDRLYDMPLRNPRDSQGGRGSGGGSAFV